MKPKHKSLETRYMEDRHQFYRSVKDLDRRSFIRVSAAAMGAVVASGKEPPHSFLPVSVAAPQATSGKAESFRFAYISDSHL